MYAASVVLTQLNLATRMHHAFVDSAQLALRDEPTLARYRDELARVYGFEAPVESALQMGPELAGIDLRERSKSGALAGDLLTLGIRPQQLARLPLCPRVGQIETIEQALGWLYVVERRSLLNAVILREVSARMPEVADQAAGYLRSYAGMASTRWRELGLAMDRLVDPDNANEVIKAAHHAFWCDRDWFHRDAVRRAS